MDREPIFGQRKKSFIVQRNNIALKSVTAELGQRAFTANSDMTGHGKIQISTAISDPNIVTGFRKILF